MRIRWLAILVLMGLAFGAVAAVGQAPASTPVPVKQSTCWTCHASWTPPLKQSANIIPGDPVQAEIGKTLPYSVQVQNAWRQEIRAYTLTVDLSAAPSLNFASNTPPISNARLDLTIPAIVDTSNPTNPAPNTGDRQAVTQLNFTQPPSSSTLTIAPDDSSGTGPTLTGLVTLPDGKTTTFPSGGPGKSITLPNIFTAQSGVFRVGAMVTAPAPPALPTPGAIKVHVTYSAEFNLEALRKLPLSWSSPMPLPFPEKSAGKIQIITGLNFTATKLPESGEHIAFWFNSTVHYTHIAPPQPKAPGLGNWANWTQPPVLVPVEAVGANKVALKPTDTTIVRLPPLNGPTLTTVGEAVGYAASFLIVSSIWSGGMFGKASRRGMNNLFGSAKRRVAFHNFLSYGIILVATVHMVLFLVDGDYKVTRGLIWGGLSILAMFGLGVTGAIQVPMIRKWNYGTWRWTHYGMTVAVILFTIVHMLLEGAHFGAVQTTLHYSDPFNPVKSG